MESNIKIRAVKCFGINEALITRHADARSMELANYDELVLSKAEMARFLKNAKVEKDKTYLKGILLQFDIFASKRMINQFHKHSIGVISENSKFLKTGPKGFVKFDIKRNCTAGVIPDTIDAVNAMLHHLGTHNFEKDGELAMDFGGDTFKFKRVSDFIDFIEENLPAGYCSWVRISTNYYDLNEFMNLEKGLLTGEKKFLKSFTNKLHLFNDLIGGK